ncbi:MAG: hypothetical protein IJR14_09050 [Synergistaceae bacterium]|nr:hypothetical protein [Synergistaceae bacterium]
MSKERGRDIHAIAEALDPDVMAEAVLIDIAGDDFIEEFCACCEHHVILVAKGEGGEEERPGCMLGVLPNEEGCARRRAWDEIVDAFRELRIDVCHTLRHVADFAGGVER